jgi:hypothetical protein
MAKASKVCPNLVGDEVGGGGCATGSVVSGTKFLVSDADCSVVRVR